MTARPRTTTLGMLLPEFGDRLSLMVGSEDDLLRPVTGASVLTSLELPSDPGVALICTDIGSPADVDRLVERIADGPSRLLILPLADPMQPRRLRQSLAGHVVVGATRSIDPAAVVVSIVGAIEAREDPVARRLASLQRSLTQALGEPDAVSALLARLKSTCNASAVLVDKRGQSVHSTGPVPLSLLYAEISHTTAETQMLDIDGWHGVADRLSDPAEGGDHMGWLIVTARRDGFPDSYAVSAVHVAAALVEASQRMTLVARRQERAIRAAVLEEAIALRRTPDDPGLAGRIASLGLDFAEELRVVVARPAHAPPARRRRVSAKELADGLGRALDSWGVGHLVSVREEFSVMLVQASVATLNQVFVASDDQVPAAQIGVGRPVRAVGEVTDSYHDAQLAVQTQRRSTSGQSMMTYEDFDFATRLFSDVGTGRMIAWAGEFLGPLEERPSLMEGLEAYFAHHQNMNAAAEELRIHHNSLRYRLAKVEELLTVSLRDPAAVSSLFLALAARDLGNVHATTSARTGQATSVGPASDVEPPRMPDDFVGPTIERLGVVRDPDH